MAEEPKIQIPLMLNVNDLAFEKAFKMILEDIIKGETRIGLLPSRSKIDAELRRTLIKGFIGVNFNDKRNQLALEELIDGIWKKMKPILTQQVKLHSSKFRKTQ